MRLFRASFWNASITKAYFDHVTMRRNRTIN
jgi:hypothetical protein